VIRVGDRSGRLAAPPGAGTRLWALGLLVIVSVAALLRVWMPGPIVRTTDELNWVSRSHGFRVAIANRDFDSAAVGAVDVDSTRPGVTTMWIGTVAEQLAPGGPVGKPGPEALRYAHVLMGIVCALAIAPFTWLAARLVGRRAALVAGGLVAVEPWLVGHSAVLHTDGLVTMSASVAILALLAAFEALRAGSAGSAVGMSRQWVPAGLAAFGGTAAAIAFLTKINGGALVVAALVASSGMHLLLLRRSVHLSRASLTSMAKVVGAFLAAAIVVTFALWPALWISPLTRLRAVIGSAELATTSSPHVFLGSVETGNDPRFYLVITYFRASAWLLVGIVGAIGWKVWGLATRRPRLVPRRITFPLLFVTGLYVLAISTSDKQYGRYALALLPFAALGIGVVVDGVTRRFAHRRAVAAVGWAGFAAAAAWTFSLAPYQLSHVNPLVGGQRVAERNISLGWGEGKEAVIDDLPQWPCPTWSGVGSYLVLCPRQDLGWMIGKGKRPEYVLTYVFDRQIGREPPRLRAYLRDHATRVSAVVIDGVAYAELWKLDPKK